MSQFMLYHYTKFESFLKIWTTKRLLFSEAQNLNDIFENNKSVSFYDFDFESHERFWEVFHKYKQISFVKDYEDSMKGCMSTMMWGHYGDGGKGVCIEFDPSCFDSESFFKLEDVEYRPMNSIPMLPAFSYCIKSIESTKEYIEENYKKFFYLKSLEWKGENEVRAIAYDTPYLDISKAIKAIYIVKWKSVETEIIERLVNNEIPIYVCIPSTNNGIQEIQIKELAEVRLSSKLQEEMIKDIKAMSNGEDIEFKHLF